RSHSSVAGSTVGRPEARPRRTELVPNGCRLSCTAVERPSRHRYIRLAWERGRDATVDRESRTGRRSLVRREEHDRTAHVRAGDLRVQEVSLPVVSLELIWREALRARAVRTDLL